MKKTTFICSLGFVFMLMACDAGDYEQHPNIGKYSSDTSDTSVQGKLAQTDLAFITQQLVASYSTHFDYSNITLSQKIALLDSASLHVPLFNSLKPAGFTLPSTTEATFYLTDYEDSYINLNVSSQMRSYLDALISTDTVDYVMLIDKINANIILTTTEKMQLQFIVTCLSDTNGDPIEDVTWTKKRIVAALQGFSKSSANAVFNMALVKITQ